MCRFVTATLPVTAPIAALDAIARAGPAVRPLARLPKVLRELDEDVLYLFHA